MVRNRCPRAAAVDEGRKGEVMGRLRAAIALMIVVLVLVFICGYYALSDQWKWAWYLLAIAWVLDKTSQQIAKWR